MADMARPLPISFVSWHSGRRAFSLALYTIADELVAKNTLETMGITTYICTPCVLSAEHPMDGSYKERSSVKG